MKKKINREPVVNGKFYPSDAIELKDTLNRLFKNVDKPEDYRDVLAIISPHAGYVFSGEVAADAFARIDPDSNLDNVFVLAPSHHASFNGASIYNIGNYETPLGEIHVNQEIANHLIDQNHLFNFYDEAHKHEHSLEVQLPFLQHWLKKPFKLVPIVIGTKNSNSLEEMAKELKPYFNKKNLFVVSSDFSHFSDYDGAIEADMRINDAILTKSIKATIGAVKKNNNSNIKNLVTSACGLSGIQILLHLIDEDSSIIIEKVKYLNSGDSKYGDHDRVVGYLSYLVYSKLSSDIDFKLSDSEKSRLLNLARKALKVKLEKEISGEVDEDNLSELLLKNYGVFVSIYNKNKLRGCIGRFDSEKPLYKLVQKMAISSAFTDSRFKKLAVDELDDIKLEISVLSPLKKVETIDDIVIGKHGIYIKQGFNKGTLLPQVATNNNWSVEEFLGYCSKNKAGIGWDGWKTAEIYIYTAEVFSE